MDVCDSTFSNMTTFKSLPQAFSKTQACTCLNCSLKPSSAAWAEDILPTRLSDPRAGNPSRHSYPAAGPSALVLHGDSHPGTGNFCWMGHWMSLFHLSICPRSQPPPTTSWGPCGAVPRYPAVMGLFPFAFPQALHGLTHTSGRRKASHKQALI